MNDATGRHPAVRKTIGGVTFDDPFDWLQHETDEALRWQDARDAEAVAYARSWPGFAAVRARLIALFGDRLHHAPRKRGRWWFGLENDGGTVRAVATGEQGERQVVAEGADLAPNASILWIDPSPRGTYLIVSYGIDGDMNGRWAILDVASRRRVADVPALNVSGARPGWLPNERGLYLGRRDEAGAHVLQFVAVAEEEAERTPCAIPPDLVDPRHPGITAQIAPDGRHALIVTEPHEHLAAALFDLETGALRRFVPLGWAGECDGSWLDGDTYVARVGDVPRGRVVSIPIATSTQRETWRELVAEGDGFLAWAGLVGDRLYVGDYVDVSLRIRVFAPDGVFVGTLPIEQPGAAPSFSFERCIRPTDALAFTHTTFRRSIAIYVHDRDDGLREIAAPQHRLEDVEVSYATATSRDGTAVPYFTVRRRDADRNGPQPTLMFGYGGFNVAVLPAFPAPFVPFIEAGGTLVQCCLRGGAEFGPAWHEAGRRHRKQHTFDDLFAIAEHVIATGVTRPERLALYGASNGGLLVGAAIAQRPELWRACAPVVPVFDMLEPLPVTPETAAVRAYFREEYGDPNDPADGPTIARWSPYHNVQDGKPYPAVFAIFGDRDLACRPFQGRKFIARLRSATTGDRPIHLRVWRDVGHGSTEPHVAATQNAEWLAAVMRELGMQP